MKSSLDIIKILKNAAVGAVMAILLNLLWYFLFRSFISTETGPIQIGSIVAASLMPTFLAGVIFWALSKFTARYRLIFQVGVVLLTLLSLFSAFATTLPDGSNAPSKFSLLSVPMHLMVGLCAFLFIPKGDQ
jgi:hypothetical protein